MRHMTLSMRAGLLFLAYILQNIEKTLFLPEWLAAQRPEYVWPGPAQFGIAGTVLTLWAAIVILLSRHYHFKGIWAWPMAILSGALLVNAGSHLLMSIANFSVMPGVLTGVALQAPLALWMLIGMVQRRYISLRGSVVASVIGAAITPLASGISLRAAQWLLA